MRSFHASTVLTTNAWQDVTLEASTRGERKTSLGRKREHAAQRHAFARVGTIHLCLLLREAFLEGTKRPTFVGTELFERRIAGFVQWADVACLDRGKRGCPPFLVALEPTKRK